MDPAVKATIEKTEAETAAILARKQSPPHD